MNYEPLAFLVCIWGSVLLNTCAAPAHGQSSPARQEQLWAARACFAEAAFRLEDCTEILHVVTRRAKPGQWLWMLRRYCSGMRPDLRNPTARQAEIRTYPWGDVPGKSEKFNRGWRELRQHVVEWGEGKHPSRCKATHWGGKMDKPKGGMVPVECATANTFYAVKR